MALAKLRVRLDGPTGKQATEVSLNGQDIREFLTELSVTFSLHDVTTATLTIMLDDLDLDAGTLAVLKAHVADRDPGDG